MKLLITSFDIALTEQETSLLNSMPVDPNQRSFHQFLKAQVSSPNTLHQTIRKARLKYKAYYQNSTYPFGIWLLRKTAIWSSRQVGKLLAK